MLENEFFPTPTAVIGKMVDSLIYKRNIRTVLDPSAGNGAILDYLKNRGRLDHLNTDFFAIELVQDLRYILQEKHYKVIGADFLAYSEPCKFDLIVMNPPFSEGVKHLLKAWELLNDGGHLVALINSETINNLCTKERELLSIIVADFGAVEALGQCFKQAERPTNVSISMVRLQKPHKESVINFDTLKVEQDAGVSAEEFSANPLAHRDVIKNLVARYNAVQSILIARKEQQSKLDFYLDGISQIVYDSCDRQQADSLVNSVALNDQIGAIKSRFWNTVFQKTKIGQKTTTDFVRKFSDFSRTQAAMAFTEENIIEVLSMFYLNRQEIMVIAQLGCLDNVRKMAKVSS